MALPKRPAEGPNPRFRGVTVNGDARDPTQRRPQPEGVKNPNTERWKQWDSGEIDESGQHHDW